MAVYAILSLQLTEFSGKEREFLIPLDEDDCGFSRAREIIEKLGPYKFQSARLGHVEDGGKVTPWLTEQELIWDMEPCEDDFPF